MTGTAPHARDAGGELGAVHARFARAVVAIYVAVSVVAIAVLVVSLLSDLERQKSDAREVLFVETQLRAQYLSRHLSLLAEEVHRLGLRPEIDLLDETLGPERMLLASSHDNSTFFNQGVALLDALGSVVWSVPSTFLATGTRPVPTKVFASLSGAEGVDIVPSDADPRASVLYVASPIMRGGRFTGALLGAIDLVAAKVVDTGFGRRTGVDVALMTREGRRLFPPPPSHVDHVLGTLDPATLRTEGPFLRDGGPAGDVVVAGMPVASTDFVFLSVVDGADLFGPARSRVASRLGIGLALAAAPLLVLSWLLRSSLTSFRVAEEEAVRVERMRSLGEAASLIAHEVKNALNGLRLGLDVVLTAGPAGREAKRDQVLLSLRREMDRLSDFTTQLLTFSKGVIPHVAPLELSVFVEKVVAVTRPLAEDRGVRIAVTTAATPLTVLADPTLVHVVLTNLLGNAVDFAGASAPPRVEVDVTASRESGLVRVTDNGPGVAEHLRGRLFEPFVTGRSNGVGIGLALSRQIARAHGGDLLLEPAATGARFVLVLPREPS